MQKHKCETTQDIIALKKVVSTKPNKKVERRKKKIKCLPCDTEFSQFDSYGKHKCETIQDISQDTTTHKVQKLQTPINLMKSEVITTTDFQKGPDLDQFKLHEISRLKNQILM